VRRVFFPLLLLIALAVLTWSREPAPRPSNSTVLDFVSLRLPPKAELARHLGPFDLEAVWQIRNPNSRFGGYSALVPLGGGRMLAISDRGNWLRFSPPGAPPSPVAIGPLRGEPAAQKLGYDAESATYDPASGQLWIGWENSNSISRHTLDFGDAPLVRPRAMRDWGNNTGPEAMVRLADGRFVVLREGWLEDERHEGLAFAGDPLTAKPPRRFTLVGPLGFRPTDTAQLPDGRLLILMRKLLWPAPARFAGRIVVADPRELDHGELLHGMVAAKLSSSLPVDNFEGLAIEPRADGKVTVWLISDDNGALSQRTLLWKLTVDPAKLPQTSKRARGSPARPSAKRQ
jgi:hypothetical protein